VESMIAKVRRATGRRGLTLKDITDLAIAGETAAVKAIEYSGTMLGRGISFLMNTVDLEGVLLSGPPELCSTGLDRMSSSKIFLDAICNEAQSRLYPTLRGAVSMEKIIEMMPFKDLDRERGAASVLLDAITGRQAARQEMSRSILTEFTGQPA
jgi:predicted NBD/HSP70 family sugar kinase